MNTPLPPTSGQIKEARNVYSHDAPASAGPLHFSLISDTLPATDDNLRSGLHLGFMVNAVIDLLAAQYGSDFLQPNIPLCHENSSTFLEAELCCARKDSGAQT